MAAFTEVVAGVIDLWKALGDGMSHAEAVLYALTGESTPAPQRPPPRRTEPDEPHAVPPERIEQLRRELPPPVVPRGGQKTHGRWIGPDGEAESITSGYDNRSGLAQSRLARMGLAQGTYRSGDVEMKLAAHMAKNGIRHATVVINNVPCKGKLNCDTLVPILLPEGFTLTVYGVTPNGTRTRTRFTGGAQPWWS